MLIFIRPKFWENHYEEGGLKAKKKKRKKERETRTKIKKCRYVTTLSLHPPTSSPISCSLFSVLILETCCLNFRCSKIESPSNLIKSEILKTVNRQNPQSYSSSLLTNIQSDWPLQDFKLKLDLKRFVNFNSFSRCAKIQRKGKTIF